jgi:hypothetical protein
MIHVEPYQFLSFFENSSWRPSSFSAKTINSNLNQIDGPTQIKQQQLSHYFHLHPVILPPILITTMSSSANTKKKRDRKQFTIDHYAERLNSSLIAAQSQCSHCQRQVPGGVKALNSHEQWCQSNPINSTSSSNKVNRSTVEKEVRKYNNDIEYSHQYRQGAAFMSSLKNKGSLMDRATKKKTKKNPRNDRR